MYVCLKAAVLLYFMLAYCRLRCALAQVHMNTSSQKRTYIFTYIHIYSYMLVFIYICMCIQRLLSVNSNHSCLTISCACNLPQCPIPMSLLIDCMDERTDERTVVYCVVALTCKWRASIIQQHQCRHYWQLRQLPVDLTLVAAIFLPHSQQLDAQTHTYIYIYIFRKLHSHICKCRKTYRHIYIYVEKTHTSIYIYVEKHTHTHTSKGTLLQQLLFKTRQFRMQKPTSAGVVSVVVFAVQWLRVLCKCVLVCVRECVNERGENLLRRLLRKALNY